MKLALDQIARLSRLLDQALDLDAAARPAWLAGLKGEDAALRPRLERMLGQTDATAAGFLSRPRLAAESMVPQAGDRIGPYTLLSELGRGGMGIVWLAEGGGGLKRRVALKLPRLVWGDRLAERMARERDIGALLEHPGIARLYDAGLDERGRPYLAFEHIVGVPIDEWCRSHALAPAQRLRLVASVACALAYAHARLVVHRDIKPSNVLVDETGQPHLLDFGIATLLHEADAPRLTQEHARVLTPHYAAPEQLRGEPVTVQSDVYALGMMACELVAGTHPYQDRRGMQDILIAQAEGEPPPPSRCTTDPALARALRGDVDAIVAMAVRHDSARRYASAQALADDIERWLAGRAVHARSDGFAYRLGKTLRRHRVALAAGAAVLTAVAAGSASALVQASRANAEATRAGAEAARAKAVKQFVIDIFKVNAPGTPANAQLRQLPAELLLEHGAEQIDKSFTQIDLQAELYGVVSGIFADMGAARQAAEYAGRQVKLLTTLNATPVQRAQAALLLAQARMAEGRPADALAEADRALSLGPLPPLTAAWAELLRAQALLEQGRLDDALAALDRVDRVEAAWTDPAATGPQATVMRARVLARGGRFDEAMQRYEAGIAQALKAQGAQSAVAVDARLLYANQLLSQRHFAAAKLQREAALTALRASGGPGELRAAQEEATQQWFLFSMGEASGAESRQIVERDRALIAARGPLVPERVRARVDLDLGAVLLDWGDIPASLPLIEGAERVLSRPYEAISQRFEMAALAGIAAMYAGRHAEAATQLERRVQLGRAGGRDEHPLVAYDLAFLAMNLLMQNRFDEADAVLATAPDFDAIAARRKLQMKGGHARPWAVVQRMKARVQLERGDVAGARALLPAEDTDADAKFPLNDRVLRAVVLCSAGERAAALALFDEQIQYHRRESFPKHPDVGRMHALAGQCALAAGQVRRARELAGSAAQVFEGEHHISAYFEAPLKDLRRRLATAR